MANSLSAIELTVHGSYRQIPTFGRNTIWRFRSNVSELKRMAAHDFEDLLQVTLGCFYVSRMFADSPSNVVVRYPCVCRSPTSAS